MIRSRTNLSFQHTLLMRSSSITSKKCVLNLRFWKLLRGTDCAEVSDSSASWSPTADHNSQNLFIDQDTGSFTFTKFLWQPEMSDSYFLLDMNSVSLTGSATVLWVMHNSHFCHKCTYCTFGRTVDWAYVSSEKWRLNWCAKRRSHANNAPFCTQCLVYNAGLKIQDSAWDYSS